MPNLKFLCNSYLLGIHLKTITGNWWPYFSSEGCLHENHGHDLKFHGFLVDFMDAASKMMNFSWSADISENWGMKPKRGPNGTFEYDGIMGDIVSEMYPLSVSAWAITLERAKFVDFSAIIFGDSIALFVIPALPHSDFGFFIKPLAMNAWIFILVLVVISIAMIYVFEICACKNSFSVEIIGCTMWLCFTLIYAFYGGALMMFFMTEEKVPIENLNQALKLVPEWKIIFHAGSEVLFDLPLQRVSKFLI